MRSSEEIYIKKMIRDEMIEFFSDELAEWQRKRQKIDSDISDILLRIDAYWRDKRQEVDNEMSEIHNNLTLRWQNKCQEIDVMLSENRHSIDTDWQSKRQEIDTMINEIPHSINDDWKNKLQEIDERMNEIHQNAVEKWQERQQEFEVESQMFYDKMKEKWESKYGEADEKIEMLLKRMEYLLPGAASAGLASKFEESKDEAGKTRWLWGGFIASIIGLSLLYGYLFWYDQENAIGWINFMIKLPIGFPIAWLAWFCQRSISQARKLREMYNHKANIMALYLGFHNAIPKELEDSLTPGTIREILTNPAKLIKDFETPAEKIFQGCGQKKEERDEG